MRYLQNPRDILTKADHDYRTFRTHCLENDVHAAAYSLLNCSTALWHYVWDWVPHAAGMSSDAKKEYKSAICLKCPPVLICQDICTGYKHVEATHYSPVTTNVQNGQYDVGPMLQVVCAAAGEHAPANEPHIVARFHVLGTGKARDRYSMSDVFSSALEFLERFEAKREKNASDIMRAVAETGDCENISRYSDLRKLKKPFSV